MALKKTKKQIGFAYGQNILGQITNLANGIRQLVEKGVGHDHRTNGEVKVECSPKDIQDSWSPEQLEAIKGFIKTFAEDPPEPPKATKPPKPPRNRP